MAINFQLIDNSTKQAVCLNQIDEEICKNVLKCEPHEKWYGGGLFNWFDSIGYKLACGVSFAVMFDSEDWGEQRSTANQIIEYLSARYTPRNW